MTTHIAPGAHPPAANEAVPPGAAHGPAAPRSRSGRPASHPLADLLARYRQVLATTWALRHEIAGPRRLRDETAFLPAALALQETPVHPAPRRLAIAICVLFTLAILWSVFGRLDIVAVASGRVIVSDRTKTIQPLEAGVIQRILVRDGDQVTVGQALIELDPTEVEADGASVAEALRAAEAEARRTAALLHALRSGRAPSLTSAPDAARSADRDPAAGRATPPNPSGPGPARPHPADTLAQAQTLAEWQDLQARLARLGAEHARREAELATVTQAIAKLEATLPLALQREADLTQLAAQGFVSGHAGQDRTRERIELERDLAVQRSRRAEAEAALAESASARSALLAETERRWRERQAEATLQREQLAQQQRKAAQRQRLATLTAPVAGTVQQLAVHTPGGVVTPAQVLMVIVPGDLDERGVAGDQRHGAGDERRSAGDERGGAQAEASRAAPPDAHGLTAEVLIDNADIGFVHPGQRAAIKLEAFPFTRYGTIEATVLQIAADAVIDEHRGAVFPARLRLERGAIDIEGKPIRLTPGMNLSAEIKTGQRAVYEYWLAPVQRAVAGSLGER